MSHDPRFFGVLLVNYVAATMLACGASSDESGTAKDAGTDSSCVPTTCEQVEANCGSAPDGCGGKIECGTCEDGQTCGGGGTNKCGIGECTAKACTSLNAQCGLASDGCSSVIDCGECTAPEVCGGDGVENQCSCTAKSCAQLGASCGTVGTSCGDVYCGDCKLPDTCGGGGIANQCGSPGGPTCENGAVSSACACGTSVISSGFCCGGVVHATDCVRVRSDGGLVSGTSTFAGKVFTPLLPYLTVGTAYDSNEGIVGNYPIATTDHDALYQNETWVESSPATFTFPVENGNYTVYVHFVDWSRSKAGERQFHVDLQGARVLTDLDIISEVGTSTALVKSFDVTVTNGEINLTFTNHVFYAEVAAVEILPQGDSPLATTSTNHAPTVNAGADQSITSPASSVTLTGTASDPDGDTLSYAWTKTAGGAATLANPTAAITQVTGLVAGSYTFTLTVDDGNGGSASDAMVVNVNAGAVVDPAWYVSPTGLDSNAGTSALAPFKTLEKARNAARASTTTKTVYLLGGTYPRTATLLLDEEDTGQSWLGFPGQTPILDGGSSTVTAIKVWADTITIRWLTIRNFAENGIFIDSWVGVVTGAVIDSNTVLNTISDDWSQAGILLGGNVTNAQITHNLVDGARYLGIGGISSGSTNMSGLTITGNAVYNTCTTVADCGGIYAGDRSHSSTNIVIENNIVGHYGSDAMDSKAIYLDDDQSNTTVRNNIVYGTGQYALQIHGGDHNIFTNNIFDISGATKLGLYQDTVSTAGMAANSFSCNIVYSSAPPPSALWDKYGLELVALPTVFDNLYWGTSGALPNTGSIIDTSPTVSNPMFVAAASADYSFASGNPAAFCGFQPIDVSQVGPRPNL